MIGCGLYTAQHNNTQTSRTVNTGDVVQIGDNDKYVIYLGPQAVLDLTDVDYSDSDNWRGLTEFVQTRTAGTYDLTQADFTDTTLWTPRNGVPIDLTNEIFDEDNGWWQVSYNTQDLLPELNFIDTEATGANGALVRNQLKSTAESYIDGATIRDDAGTGGAQAVHVTADSRSILRSENSSETVASGGNSFSDGGSNLAVNAMIVTNQHMSKTDAYIIDADIDTDGTGTQTKQFTDFDRLAVYDYDETLGIDKFERNLETDADGKAVYRVDISGDANDGALVKRLNVDLYLLENDTDNLLRLMKYYDGVTRDDADGYVKGTLFQNDFVFDGTNWYRYIGEDGEEVIFENNDNDPDVTLADFTDATVWQQLTAYDASQVDRGIVNTEREFSGFGAWELQDNTGNNEYIDRATRNDGVTVVATQNSILDATSDYQLSAVGDLSVGVAFL